VDDLPWVEVGDEGAALGKDVPHDVVLILPDSTFGAVRLERPRVWPFAEA